MNDTEVGTGLDAAVRRLHQARRRAAACGPIRDLIKDDVDLAYAAQHAFVEAEISTGARVVGRKVGLTNPTVQQQFNVDSPDYGTLLDDMWRESGAVVNTSELFAPRLEVEVAFVLAQDVDRTNTPFTAESVRPLVDHACAAFEIVDSRIAHWDLTLVDTVADNGSSALFVTGNQPAPLEAINIADVEMELLRDGIEVSTGTGRNSLGDPLNALAWIANEAQRRGQTLRRGDIILSGALGPVVKIESGDKYTARISGLGSISISFA